MKRCVTGKAIFWKERLANRAAAIALTPRAAYTDGSWGTRTASLFELERDGAEQKEEVT